MCIPFAHIFYVANSTTLNFCLPSYMCFWLANTASLSGIKFDAASELKWDFVMQCKYVRLYGIMLEKV